MYDKVELATKYLATQHDKHFLPIMADRALQEMKRHMYENNMKPYSEPEERLVRYLSGNTGRWHMYDPTYGFVYGEDDVVMYEYQMTQWAVERD